MEVVTANLNNGKKFNQLMIQIWKRIYIHCFTKFTRFTFTKQYHCLFYSLEVGREAASTTKGWKEGLCSLKQNIMQYYANTVNSKKLT